MRIIRGRAHEAAQHCVFAFAQGYSLHAAQRENTSWPSNQNQTQNNDKENTSCMGTRALRMALKHEFGQVGAVILQSAAEALHTTRRG